MQAPEVQTYSHVEWSEGMLRATEHVNSEKREFTDY